MRLRHSSGFFGDEGGRQFQDVYALGQFLAFGSFGEARGERAGRGPTDRSVRLSAVRIRSPLG